MREHHSMLNHVSIKVCTVRLIITYRSTLNLVVAEETDHVVTIISADI